MSATGVIDREAKRLAGRRSSGLAWREAAIAATRFPYRRIFRPAGLRLTVVRTACPWDQRARRALRCRPQYQVTVRPPRSLHSHRAASPATSASPASSASRSPPARPRASPGRRRHTGIHAQLNRERQATARAPNRTVRGRSRKPRRVHTDRPHAPGSRTSAGRATQRRRNTDVVGASWQPGAFPAGNRMVGIAWDRSCRDTLTAEHCKVILTRWQDTAEVPSPTGR